MGRGRGGCFPGPGQPESVRARARGAGGNKGQGGVVGFCSVLFPFEEELSHMEALGAGREIRGKDDGWCKSSEKAHRLPPRLQMHRERHVLGWGGLRTEPCAFAWISCLCDPAPAPRVIQRLLG